MPPRVSRQKAVKIQAGVTTFRHVYADSNALTP